MRAFGRFLRLYLAEGHLQRIRGTIRAELLFQAENLYGLEPCRKLSSELTRSLTDGRVRLRVNQIAYGLGLSEIQAAVREGTHREFAGFGRTRAQREKRVYDSAVAEAASHDS
jgi:hypothetical protein